MGVLAIGMLGAQATGSGGPPPMPDYVTATALSPDDIAALANGRLGILKGRASDAVLYLDWRLLHHLTVGSAAAAALTTPCCGETGDRSEAWIEARRKIPGSTKDVFYIATDRPGPDYTSVPTCFQDAFTTAVATLKDRSARYGAASPAVRAWVAAQDAVFQACSTPGVALPPLPAGAPAWLRADHDYQAAALALYDGRLGEAGQRFAAIARDHSSPWQPKALYLQVRVAQRDALLHPDAPHFAQAHAATRRLAAAPAGTFGQDAIGRMEQVLAYREHPRALLARLDRQLNEPAPTADIAVRFKDYMSLPTLVTPAPDAADWIRTVHTSKPGAGLAHARARWSATHDPAWLLAALALAAPGDPAAAALAGDAARVSTSAPAWLSAQYHLMRLTIASADPAAQRARADAILARTDLTRSDRNIIAAIRAQLSTDLADFVRFALRDPYCTAIHGGCVDGDTPQGDGLLGRRGRGFVGFGGDARAVIDRLPLAERMRLTSDPAIPRDLRRDLALTNYVRAVLLQDDRTVDRLATMLATLLPQVRRDWQTIARTRRRPDKRFAEFLVMAKIPTLRTDLADYQRPVGARDQDFGGYWVDWLLRRTPTAQPFPPEPAYMPEAWWGIGSEAYSTDQPVDLTCYGKCGAGAFPLHLPSFARPLASAALAERRRFVARRYGAIAVGTVSLWDEMLAYARAHPRDPRSPEALYRLIRVARWGGNHDHLGKRAFALLHARYPNSLWAERAPFYYDDAR